MSEFNSSLVLQRLVYDKIKFERKGFKNENELKFGLQVQIGMSEDGVYKVTLILSGDKLDEYELVISLSGFFVIEGKDELDKQVVNDLISKNAVAILMPYLRSELTLLTSQPETDSIVLPPFNINKMIENNTDSNNHDSEEI